MLNQFIVIDLLNNTKIWFQEFYNAIFSWCSFVSRCVILVEISFEDSLQKCEETQQCLKNSRVSKNEVKIWGKKNIDNYVWGVPNFLPEIVPGADESSLTVHVTRLKQQHELPTAKRNNENIKISKRKTFLECRRKLIVDLMSIEDFTGISNLVHRNSGI